MELLIVVNAPTACGIGEGDACCAYLAGQPGRFICGRSSPSIRRTIDARIAAGQMSAKYAPGDGVPYPECQEQRPRSRHEAAPLSGGGVK